MKHSCYPVFLFLESVSYLAILLGGTFHVYLSDGILNVLESTAPENNYVTLSYLLFIRCANDLNGLFMMHTI